MRAIALIAALACSPSIAAAGGADTCINRPTHVLCRLPGGKEELSFDADTSRYFHSNAPSVVFVDKNGVLHTITSNCHITCRP